MTLIGIPPPEWINLIDTLVPDILNLVISTWEGMPPPAPDALEDPTTEELCRCLRQNRTSSDLPFRIDTQLVELDPAVDEEQGRMDIVFSPMVPRESIYFCLECKRLNVVYEKSVRAYAAEYVLYGMMRFVRGQYSAEVCHGGMLGYVLNGDLGRAIKNVRGAIKANHRDLGMKAPGEMQPSSILPGNSRMKETHHKRQHRSDSFQIHHIFVSGMVIDLLRTEGEERVEEIAVQHRALGDLEHFDQLRRHVLRQLEREKDLRPFFEGHG
jgi:hypothetical protein